MAREDGGEKVMWFLAGVAIGAAVGLLFAPKTGRELRQLLGQKTAEGKDRLVDAGREIYDRGREIFEKGKDLADDAAELFERGRKAVRL